MGIARWYFYGTSSWSDQATRAAIDTKKQPFGILRGQVQRSENRAAKRKKGRRLGR